jgi:hypothetical protein
MSIRVDTSGTTYAQPKLDIEELDKFGIDIGKSLHTLIDKWKTDDHKKKSILRRISTKSKNFLLNKKKTLTEEDIEEMRERVEQIPLAPPTMSSLKRTMDPVTKRTATLPNRRSFVIPDSLMETQSETEISSTPKEDDTRTCLTEPDQTEKVEYWLQEKQTCSLNTRYYSKQRSKSLGRPKIQSPGACVGPNGIKKLLFG